MKKAIEKLRELVRCEEYEISTHANEEMSNDDLVALDVENAILTGKIEIRFTRDPRGTRSMKSSAKRVIIDPSRLYAESGETVVSSLSLCTR